MNNHANRFPVGHVIGFFMSLVLTFGAAWIALKTSLPARMVMTIIGSLAIIQAVIQLTLFMHMREGEDKTANTINIAYAFFMAVVVVAGSIWLMVSGHSH